MSEAIIHLPRELALDVLLTWMASTSGGEDPKDAQAVQAEIARIEEER